jgi:hypothetical protein
MAPGEVHEDAAEVKNPDDLLEVATAFFGWPWFGADEDEASKKAAAGPNGACVRAALGAPVPRRGLACHAEGLRAALEARVPRAASRLGTRVGRGVCMCLACCVSTTPALVAAAVADAARDTQAASLTLAQPRGAATPAPT